MEMNYSTPNRQTMLDKLAGIVQRVLNAPAPISKVPPEILGFVFHISIEESTRDLLYLMLVCKDWQHVALHTPELWTTIHIKIALESIKRRDQSRQIKLCIENSGCLPLHLNFDAGGRLDPQTSQYHSRNLKRDISNAFLELKEQSQALSERWRSWRIILPCTQGGLIIGPDIVVLLMIPAPNLVRVTLRNLLAPRGPEAWPAILRQHAALKQLVIDDSGFSNIPESVNTPKYLEIGINLGQFDLIQLQRFRGLNTLIIRRSTSNTFLVMLHGTLKLDHLRVLSLGNATEVDQSTCLVFPTLYALCIGSGRPRQATLPRVNPIRLVWNPKDPYLLGHFKQKGLVIHYLKLLLATYQSIEHLVLPGGPFRPFFDLVSLPPLLPLTLTSLAFDNSPAAPCNYHIVNGRLEPLSQAPPIEYDWTSSFD